MPSWGKVLSDQQIADVAEYVFTAFIHPDDGQSVADKKKLNQAP
jgi:mono/diheme cytochrome c family protein